MTSNPAAEPHDRDHEHAAHGSSADGPRDFGAQWWEQHYRDAGTGPIGQPSAQLIAELLGVAAGTALDAGCGTGADAVWLAGQGWDVTAVDVAPSAVERARALAAQYAPGASERITWLVADLTEWRPPRQFDLVLSQYVHPDLPFAEFVARLAEAVAPGGTLLVVGHDHADAHSAAHAPRPASIGAEAVLSALDPSRWDVIVAETRSRQVTRGSTAVALEDLVVRARRSG